MHSSFAITNTEYLLLLLHFLTKLKDILMPSDISSCMSVDKKPKAKQNQTKKHRCLQRRWRVEIFQCAVSEGNGVLL